MLLTNHSYYFKIQIKNLLADVYFEIYTGVFTYISKYHKEPNKDRQCSGRFYSKQQLGVCANILLLSPFPRLCNRISRYLWHWSRCSFLYRGHNRLLCRRNKVWLQRWRTEWDQFINGCGSRILDGCCISRNMLLITCSRRHRAEICPQHIEQSQHTL